MSRVLMVCAASLSLLVLADATHATKQVPLNPVEGVYRSGEWQYQLVILNGGLPGARAIGKLTYRCKEVIGIAWARITTDLGQFQWAGYGCEAEQVGWYRINPEKKYARWERVRIDESQIEPVWIVTRE